MLNYEKKDFQLAEEFAGIALGADRFYRHLQEEESKANKEASFRTEGLVPVDFTGVQPKEIHSWEEAIQGLDAVYAGYETIADPTRRNYMLQQVGSFRKVLYWLSGKPMSFREIAAETMFLDANPVGEKQIQQEIDAMDCLLSEAGYTGNVREKYAAWHEERKTKSPEEMQQVLQQLLYEAKQKTLALGFSCIRDFDVKAEIVFDVPYNAYCDYFTREIRINGVVSYTKDELKHLVCHEAYPGHMTHMALREELLRAGKIPADAGLVLTNTASSPVFEGIADNGNEVLGWNTDVHEKICRHLNRLHDMCNINASHMMYVEGKSKEEIIAYLKERAFMSDVQAAARIRYFGYPFRKAYMYPYWRGWDAVETKWMSLKPEEKEPFLTYLYSNMHSIDTVKQFGENF